MALRFIDSFDHYATAQIGLKWTGYDSAFGQVTIDTSVKRTGRASMRLYHGSFGANAWKTIDDQATWIVGFALRVSALGGAKLQLRDSAGSVQLDLISNADGTLSVRRGGTVVLGTTTSVIAVNTQYYIELKVYIHDSAGTVDLHINGSGIGGISLTGQDTKATAIATARTFYFHEDSPTYVYIDDLYICDGTGTRNNDFLGDVRIECLLPTGDGATHTFTPSTGADHYAVVDEATPDTGDYNGSSTVDQKDTLTFPDLATITGVVCGVQTALYAAKSDAGARTICPVVRSGGADYDGTPAAPPTTPPVYVFDLREVNPADSEAWSIADVNAAEFGYKVVT